MHDSILRYQYLVLDQHANAARPAFVGPGEIRFLLIEKFAIPGVADLNLNVVIRLSDPGHDADEGLFRTQLQRDARLTTVAMPQTSSRHWLSVYLAYIDEAVPP